MPGSCRACGPLLAEAEAGRNWLKGLTEVEPPASLVNNILASTTGVDTQRLRTTAPAPPAASFVAGASAGIVPGADLGHGPAAALCHVVRHGILRAVGGPDGCRRKTRRHAYRSACGRPRSGTRTTTRRLAWCAITTTYASSTKCRRMFAGSSASRRPPSPVRRNHKQRKNDTTQQPEQKQDRNYSQTENQLILASDPLGPSLRDLPVVSVTTYRRFV